MGGIKSKKSVVSWKSSKDVSLRRKKGNELWWMLLGLHSGRGGM